MCAVAACVGFTRIAHLSPWTPQGLARLCKALQSLARVAPPPHRGGLERRRGASALRDPGAGHRSLTRLRMHEQLSTLSMRSSMRSSSAHCKQGPGSPKAGRAQAGHSTCTDRPQPGLRPPKGRAGHRQATQHSLASRTAVHCTSLCCFLAPSRCCYPARTHRAGQAGRARDAASPLRNSTGRRQERLRQPPGAEQLVTA